jgi:signal transduction histidine kinase
MDVRSNQNGLFAPAAAEAPPRVDGWLGLSGKLLLLTTLFVMIAEVLIYVPSIASYRLMWINDRLAAAHTAALVLDAAPSGMVPESLAQEILASIGAKSVAMKVDNTRRLLVANKIDSTVAQEVDMRNPSTSRSWVAAFETLFLRRDADLLRAVGPAPMGGDFVEIVVEEGPLRQAMLAYSRNILRVSLLISGITAVLVYSALYVLFVRPMHRITANMMAFRRDPENPARIVTPSSRRDEIGTVQRELAAMQADLASMLHQRSRLAALGLAVSKINHDLRNMLSSAQLFSDRLATVHDPVVQRFAPKLMHALERAIVFCQSTLSYGSINEPAPDRRRIAIAPLIDEVRETLGLVPEASIGFVAAVERGLVVEADREQLLRVLTNLIRNALQALELRAPNNPERDQIRITGRREGAVTLLEISDTGPGLPEKTQAHLFEAFSGSSRPGGTGLGLAIAAELVQAHGGELRYVNGTIGATFHITIPDAPIELRPQMTAAE